MILDLIALNDNSKVWIYQSDRALTYRELELSRGLIFEFLENWTSHQVELCTYANIFHKRFLALFVDESAATGASGCSIDASVRFVTELGNRLGVDFLDRMTYCYLDANENVQTVHHFDLPELYQNGTVTDETLFFDNLVKTKAAFKASWLKPLKDSWHYRFVS